MFQIILINIVNLMFLVKMFLFLFVNILKNKNIQVYSVLVFIGYLLLWFYCVELFNLNKIIFHINDNLEQHSYMNLTNVFLVLFKFFKKNNRKSDSSFYCAGPRKSESFYCEGPTCQSEEKKLNSNIKETKENKNLKNIQSLKRWYEPAKDLSAIPRYRANKTLSTLPERDSGYSFRDNRIISKFFN
jgi:hypothetical protein